MATAPVSRETTNGTKLRRIAGGAKPEEPTSVPTQLLRIPLESIDIGDNVRKDLEGIDELAASILEHGVIQPVKVVAATGDRKGRYDLVYGQRRVLASLQAGQSHILAIVDLLSSDVATAGPTRSIEQLIENLHRADLNPVDRARAMRQVVDSGVSQADLARELGLAPSTVANDLGILAAPKPVLSLIEEGKLSPAHQRAMKGLDPKQQVELARDAAANGYSAHRTEDEVQRRKRAAESEAARREKQAKENAAEREQLAASIADFEKKKVGKSDVIVVTMNHGSGTAGHLVELIKAAGYEKVRIAKSWNEAQARPGGGVCDCTAWKATESTTYGRYDHNTGGYVDSKYRITIAKACIVPKHQQAKEAAAEAVRQEKAGLERKVQQHVRETAFGVAIAATSTDTPLLIGIPRVLAEAALWDALGYRLPTWSKAHGGTEQKAWAAIHALSDETLATELASELAADFRDKAGYHIDWPNLAEDLGLVGKPTEPVTAPTDTRPQPEVGDPVVDAESGTKYRIRKVDPHAVYLVESGPGWRSEDVAVLADPSRLTYEKEAGVWRGPTVPAAGLITDIPKSPGPNEARQARINAAASEAAGA